MCPRKTLQKDEPSVIGAEEVGLTAYREESVFCEIKLEICDIAFRAMIPLITRFVEFGCGSPSTVVLRDLVTMPRRVIVTTHESGGNIA